MTRYVYIWICLALFLGTQSSVLAQTGGGGQGGGGGNGNGGQFPGGILISPSGLVDRAAVSAANAGALRQLKNQAQKALAPELNQVSSQRFVSLAKLDREIAQRLNDSKVLTSEIRFLAGLNRIDFVVIEENDVLLVGPASGFGVSPEGRMVSVETGRPVLCLDDLLTALRGASQEDAVGCSMDPDVGRVQQAMEWLNANSAPSTPAMARAKMQRCVELQGEWTVTTFGVPETSRMCLAMVEADYLMKRIAIGLENPNVKGMKSSLSLARPNDNMMRRWWFAPNYVLERSGDSRVFAFGGPRLQLYGREELIGENGQIIDANLKQPSSEKFAQLFNERIGPLTEKVPAFADLQNMFDILTAVAVIDDAEAAARLSWELLALRDSSLLPTAIYNVPKTTLPEVNTKSAGSLIIGAFSGGVTIRPSSQLAKFALKGESTTAESEKTKTGKDELPQWPVEDEIAVGKSSESWWWDASEDDGAKEDRSKRTR